MIARIHTVIMFDIVLYEFVPLKYINWHGQKFAGNAAGTSSDSVF
jgi:hypothetical protein